jgi:hypothetical protein
MKKQKNTILVVTNDQVSMRGRAPKEIEVEVLGKNINLFITQIGNILENTPDHVKKFRLSQITISAEVSAKGGLMLLGTGVETEGKGGVIFVFTRT